MKKSAIMTAIFLIIFIVLIYQLIIDAIRKDNLIQAIKSEQQSVDHLLTFISINNPCEMSPHELADAMGSARPERLEVFSSGDLQEVSAETFRADFINGNLNYVEIVDFRRVKVCKK